MLGVLKGRMSDYKGWERMPERWFLVFEQSRWKSRIFFKRTKISISYFLIFSQKNWHSSLFLIISHDAFFESNLHYVLAKNTVILQQIRVVIHWDLEYYQMYLVRVFFSKECRWWITLCVFENQVYQAINRHERETIDGTEFLLRFENISFR